jgi:hypothetical protein
VLDARPALVAGACSVVALKYGRTGRHLVRL